MSPVAAAAVAAAGIAAAEAQHMFAMWDAQRRWDEVEAEHDTHDLDHEEGMRVDIGGGMSSWEQSSIS